MDVRVPSGHGDPLFEPVAKSNERLKIARVSKYVCASGFHLMICSKEL